MVIRGTGGRACCDRGLSGNETELGYNPDA